MPLSPAFAAAVDRIAPGRSPAGDRRHRDEPSLAPRQHEPHRLAREDEAGDEVGLDERAHLVVAELEQRLTVARPDIVDQNVEAAVLRRDRREGRGRAGLSAMSKGSVSTGPPSPSMRAAAASSRATSRPLSMHGPAGTGERLGDLEAEAAAGAGDEDDLAGEVELLEGRQHGRG